MSSLFQRTLACLLGLTLLFGSPSFAQEEPSAPQIDAAIVDAQLDIESLAILLVPLTAAELAEVANGWQANVHSEMGEIAQLNLKINKAKDGELTLLREELVKMSELQAALQDKYSEVLTAWQIKGGTPEELQSHYDYLSGLKAGSFTANDPVALARTVGKWLTSVDGGIGVLLKIGGLVLAIWVMMFVAKFVRRLARKGVEKIPNLSNLLKSFILTAIYWLTFAVGIMVVLAMFGVNVGPVFAVLGGLSFILAFALQDTLGNLASGLMIMILKPFDTADFIHINGASGTVDEMSIVSTRIRTVDNQIIVVPNSKIWGDVITNVNASDTRRVDLVFGIGYSDSADQAIEILNNLASNHDLVIAEPATEIFVAELGDSSVNIFCRPWVKSADYWTVYWDILAQAKERFDAEGISIPFPQRDVYVHQVTLDAIQK